MYENNLRDNQRKNQYARKFGEYIMQFQEDYNKIIGDISRQVSSHIGNYSNKNNLLISGRTLSPCNLKYK